MLASRDLFNELETMVKTMETLELSESEKIQMNCFILLLKLLRDIRSNQVTDLKSRGLFITPGKQGGKNGQETTKG